MDFFKEFFSLIFQILAPIILIVVIIILIGAVILFLLGYADVLRQSAKDKRKERIRRNYWNNLPNTYENKSNRIMLEVYDKLTENSTLEAKMSKLEYKLKPNQNKSENFDDIVNDMADIMIFELSSDQLQSNKKAVQNLLGKYPEYPDLDIKYLKSKLKL